MRIFRIYASRLIRSAARSNWLWTIARPDIGARLGRGDWSGAVMGLHRLSLCSASTVLKDNVCRAHPSGCENETRSCGTQAPAGEPGAGVSGSVQGLSGIRGALAARTAIGQYAYDVARDGRRRFAGVLEREDEPNLLTGHLGDCAVPAAIGGGRSQADDQGTDRGIERDRRDQWGSSANARSSASNARLRSPSR